MVCVWVVALLVALVVVSSNLPSGSYFSMGLDWILSDSKDWINNVNIHGKQLGLILGPLEIQDRINPPN